MKRIARQTLNFIFVYSVIVKGVFSFPTWSATAVVVSSSHGQPHYLTTMQIGSSSEMYIIHMLIAALLVLTGGFFAGLTLGLMGLDETNLQVMVESGSDSEKKNALRVLCLLERGKYWVLVTLLLSNVIVNEALPIVLDSVIGNGWLAVLISTALIVTFGEVIPQSVCVRYGLAVGAKCSPVVLVMMYVMFPIAYPASYALEYFLGESHGTIYKKAGLKSLVSLHQTDNQEDADGLTEDEVHIIASVLDLRGKSVIEVMTPMSDVFCLSYHTTLDKKLVFNILKNGYSRIPIKESDNSNNYIGMLLVKNLISYDFEDNLSVNDFPISVLPETFPDTSCLDILNFFQEGKSHMAIVSNNPGCHYGALGIVTLEDVIESLIGEEIVDETDVFVNVQKRIKVNRTHKEPTATSTAVLPFVRIQSDGGNNINDGATGIKIRMKGYGAIVDNNASTSTNLPSFAQQSHPFNGINERKF